MENTIYLLSRYNNVMFAVMLWLKHNNFEKEPIYKTVCDMCSQDDKIFDLASMELTKIKLKD